MFILLMLFFLLAFQITLSFALETYIWNNIIIQEEYAISFVEIR